MSHSSDLIADDILSYLRQHEVKDLLRFLTCGSVDDGKSTFIGRLLHDSQLVYEDQLAAVRKDSGKYGTTEDGVDLALLVDGLQSEREQGITIDVAYRYFSTDRRKFIIADTPGHEQYTRNMATGASTSQLAVILIDARHGVQVQTRRHSYICALLGIRHVVAAVNKMDLVAYSEQTYKAIEAEYTALAHRMGIPDVQCVPISALQGDNVVHPSTNMPWYTGATLMRRLETVEVAGDKDLYHLRMPVQYVQRPSHDFRGFSGTLAAGQVRPGDPVVALPSGQRSTVERIVTWEGDLDVAFPPQAVTLTLADEIDISRGDILATPANPPSVSDTLDARIVWMAEQPLLTGRQYDVKLATANVPAVVSHIHHRIDVNTLETEPSEALGLNEIGLCRVQLQAPTAFDPYEEIARTGSFILIDRITNHTVAAGMVAKPADVAGLDVDAHRPVTRAERGSQKAQRPTRVHLTGDAEAAARVADATDRALLLKGYHAFRAPDGTPAETLGALVDAGLIVLVSGDSVAGTAGGQDSAADFVVEVAIAADEDVESALQRVMDTLVREGVLRLG